MIKEALQLAVNIIPYPMRSLIRHTPGIKRFQQRLLATHLHGAEFEHRINGGPAHNLVYPVVLPQDKQIWIGNYEQKFTETLAAAVVADGVCYDIGGYRGFLSGVMACQGAKSVHCFEPIASNVAQIKRMASLNPQMPITVHQLALADSPGTTEFSVMPEGSMGKLARSEFDSGDMHESIVDVTVETIDRLIDQGRILPASLIKIDVEGAELLVLRGATKLIEEYRPVLYIEAHSHSLARKCVGFLQPYGYVFKALETGKEPDFLTEPNVCHLEAKPTLSGEDLIVAIPPPRSRFEPAGWDVAPSSGGQMIAAQRESTSGSPFAGRFYSGLRHRSAVRTGAVAAALACGGLMFLMNCRVERIGYKCWFRNVL